MTSVQIAEVVRLYGRGTDSDFSKTFDNVDFGYTRVTVERPLRLRYQMTSVNALKASRCAAPGKH